MILFQSPRGALKRYSEAGKYRYKKKKKKSVYLLLYSSQFGQIINISLHLLTMLKSTNGEFQSTELWFTDQNNRPLEIQHSINITLIIG